VDEVALIRDTISHYVPVLSAPLSNPSRRHVGDSLQQQTATADVLKVISRSTFDLQAVLDTLVEAAARLCSAASAAIHRPQGDFYPYIASYGYSPEYDEYMRANPIRAGSSSSVLSRVVLQRRAVQVADILSDPDYAGAAKTRAQVGGFRTIAGVPLLRQGSPIGVLILTRSIVFGGLWMALGWVVAAVVMAITILGLPWREPRSTSPPTHCCHSATRPYRATNISAAKTSAPAR
jgi:GAF domain